MPPLVEDVVPVLVLVLGEAVAEGLVDAALVGILIPLRRMSCGFHDDSLTLVP